MSRFRLSPLNQRRFARFRANRRGWWSLHIFLVLFVLSLGAELIANDKPLVVGYQDELYFPVFKRYAETEFGGEFPIEADYRSPYVRELIEDRKSTRLNSSHVRISYAVFCLKKKRKK